MQVKVRAIYNFDSDVGNRSTPTIQEMRRVSVRIEKVLIHKEFYKAGDANMTFMDSCGHPLLLGRSSWHIRHDDMVIKGSIKHCQAYQDQAPFHNTTGFFITFDEYTPTMDVDEVSIMFEDVSDSYTPELQKGLVVLDDKPENWLIRCEADGRVGKLATKHSDALTQRGIREGSSLRFDLEQVYMKRHGTYLTVYLSITK